jgi:DNA modification methylase
LKDRILAVKAEVQRLLDANVIREVKYSEWLANVLLVLKKNGKMRICIDFTNLNKACKKRPVFTTKSRCLRRQGSRVQALLPPRLFFRISPDLAQQRR